LGKFITGAVYLGVLALVVDHYLVIREQRLDAAVSGPVSPS
jgi:hypothetical protein